MSTLIIKTGAPIKNPKFGNIAELDSSLRFALDARHLALQNGDTVRSWESHRGSGSKEERLFNRKNSNLSYPIFNNENGVQSVRFDGNAQLLNNNNNQHFVDQATYVVVAKLDTLTPTGSYARLFTGDLNDKIGESSFKMWHGVTIAGGSIYMTSGQTLGDTKTGSGVNLTPSVNEWFAAVFVFDGINSKAMLSNTESIVENKLTASKQDVIALGTSAENNTANSSGMLGNIRYIAQYDRAFDATEMIDTINSMKERFKI